MSELLLGSSRRPRHKKSLLREYAEALVIALLLALFIRYFFVQAFKIPSESMVPTLLVGDHILANKFAYGIKIPYTDIYLYRGGEPRRGDIIVFANPNDPEVDYIKRVIGVPGDKIKIVNKQLFVNDKPVKEDYVQFKFKNTIEPNSPRDNFAEITIPKDNYFMMGDNRDDSLDSRFWGLVDRPKLKAKAWKIYWSYGDDKNGKNSGVRWNRLGKNVE